ncbi:MAG: hypothetical protein QGI51_03305 [Dehalococcoidales bacterium]|jgi:hypothetical protein|nr:hypothetical protein [Dehalococcoidales bacterium]MDP6824974.1 hypothetical protein [Dehalococcoidales bacterium]
MPEVSGHEPASHLTQTPNSQALRHLEQAIISGKHWYLALLEAIGLWDTIKETQDGRTYQYLIAAEAFDWLLLAERLCRAVDSLLPEGEKTALLFHGKPPLDLPPGEFKELIGSVKYLQHLNYFYGATVEEALILAVEEEVRKERWISGYYREKDAAYTTNEAYRRIYATTKAVMLRRFRQNRGYPQLKSISLAELKEFTYWLFKHRLKQCDKAKVASDTKKALDWLKSNGFSQQPDRSDSDLEFINMLPSSPAG